MVRRWRINRKNWWGDCLRGQLCILEAVVLNMLAFVRECIAKISGCTSNTEYALFCYPTPSSTYTLDLAGFRLSLNLLLPKPFPNTAISLILLLPLLQLP